ncbi:hypothetical protein D3C77_257510 [compost metagenome]
MFKLVPQGNVLILVMHAVVHHFRQSRQQRINSRHLQFQRQRAYNLQRIIQKMGIDLGLHRPQLIRLVRQFQLVFTQNQVIDRIHHTAEAQHDRTNLVIAGRLDVNVQI